MTKEQNEGATQTTDTATQSSAADTAQQASASAEPTVVSTTSAPTEPKTDTAQQSAAEPSAKKASTTPPPLPKQADTPSEAPQTADDLKAQLAALQQRLDAMETKRTTEARTAEIERIIAPLSDTLKAVYRRTAYTTLPEAEYNTLRSTIQAEVSELAKSTTTRGAVFGRPTESIPSGSKASDKETAEVLRRLNL